VILTRNSVIFTGLKVLFNIFLQKKKQL
jgi:hypothetical protein